MTKHDCACGRAEDLKKERDSLRERLLLERKKCREAEEQARLMIQGSRELSALLDAILIRLGQLYGTKLSYPDGTTHGFELTLSCVDAQQLNREYAVRAVRLPETDGYRIRAVRREESKTKEAKNKEETENEQKV